ncbi:MAG: hypothetical protein ACP5DC_10500 [Halothiobacillaceae bacterium]
MTFSLRRLAWPIKLVKMVVRRNSYLHSTGWVESLKRGYPCRAGGEAIPWMNYQVVDLLDQRLQPDLSLFEFGSGFSTRFYAQRVRQVRSVEYDQRWFDQVSRDVPANVTMLYRKKDVNGHYCRSIRETGECYDVVIVDGRDRVNCVRQSLECLSDRGVLLLDDSERPDYEEAFEIARGMGFRVLDLKGLKPTKLKPARSSIFYRNDNCLGL